MALRLPTLWIPLDPKDLQSAARNLAGIAAVASAIKLIGAIGKAASGQAVAQPALLLPPAPMKILEQIMGLPTYDY
jgi:hypothetical protein